MTSEYREYMPVRLVFPCLHTEVCLLTNGSVLLPAVQPMLTSYLTLQVNYQTLPINQPRCPFHVNNHDGAMNFVDRDEEVTLCSCITRRVTYCMNFVLVSSADGHIKGLVCKPAVSILITRPTILCTPGMASLPACGSHTQDWRAHCYSGILVDV